MRAQAQSQMQEMENDSTFNILAFAFAVRCFLVLDTVCACVTPIKQPSETPSQQHNKQHREKIHLHFCNQILFLLVGVCIL